MGNLTEADIARIIRDVENGGQYIHAPASAARLIAAAPDMLALLKLALGDAEYVLSQGFWDEVRAVIAKAEGSNGNG